MGRLVPRISPGGRGEGDGAYLKNRDQIIVVGMRGHAIAVGTKLLEGIQRHATPKQLEI